MDRISVSKNFFAGKTYYIYNQKKTMECLSIESMILNNATAQLDSNNVPSIIDCCCIGISIDEASTYLELTSMDVVFWPLSIPINRFY